MVVLRLEEKGRPPPLEPLKLVPFLAPQRLQMKQKYDLVNWVLIGLNRLVNAQSLSDKGMHVQVLDHNVELSRA